MLRDEDEQRLPVEKMARIRRIMRMVAEVEVEVDQQQLPKFFLLALLGRVYPVYFCARINLLYLCRNSTDFPPLSSCS